MSKSHKNLAPLPLTQLFGDTEENFYQLGIKDRERHGLILEGIKNLTKTPWNLLNRTLEELIKNLLNKALPFYPEYKRLLDSYAEGLNRHSSELAYVFLIPEFVSALSRWVPGLPTTLLGCSSFMARESDSQQIIHGRILDFPLQGSFDSLERATLLSFNNRAKIFSYGAIGMPFPSITCMNEHGLTLALHQKFSDQLSSKGIPIFYLIFEMMSHCRDLNDVRELLKKSHTITTWGLYLTHKSGEICAIDVSPEGNHEKELHLEENEIIYLGNRNFNPKSQKPQIMPWGFDIYNEQREQIAEKKIARLKKGKKLDAVELIKEMGKLEDQSKSANHDWKIDPLTPATLQNCVMNAASGSSYFIPGKAPKFLNDKILHFENLWSAPVEKVENIKIKPDPELIVNGIRYLMQAQVDHDKNDFHSCYHHCQLAIDFLKDRPEESIAKFYFYVFQFMHEDHQKMLAHLLSDFKKLAIPMNSYLDDHRKLFINRLERILGLKTSIQLEDINNVNLKKIYEFESKWKPQIVHSALRKLTNPRVEIFDIIYAHIKI